MRNKQFTALANCCLVAGLVLWVFATSVPEPRRPWLHATAGFLMGFSIALNVGMLVNRRGAKAKGPQAS